MLLVAESSIGFIDTVRAPQMSLPRTVIRNTFQIPWSENKKSQKGNAVI